MPYMMSTLNQTPSPSTLNTPVYSTITLGSRLLSTSTFQASEFLFIFKLYGFVNVSSMQ